MGLKRLWMRIFGKSKKPPLARVDPRTHSIEPPEPPIATPLLQGEVVGSKTTDAVNDHGSLSLWNTNELSSSPSFNPNNTVALQVGHCPMPLGMPPYIEDAGTVVVSRNRTDFYETPSVSVLALQPILPDKQAVAPSDQYPSPPANRWRKIFTLKNLTRRSQHYHGLTVNPCLYPNTRAVDVNAISKSEHLDPPILASNRHKQPSQLHNQLLNQPPVPSNEKETAGDLSHKTRSELSVRQSDEVFVDASNHALRLWNRKKDDSRTTRTGEVQMDHQLYRTKPLPEIPQHRSEETVGELEPEEVILYPRNDELEALRRQYPSSPPVEANNEAQNSQRKFPEVVHRPLVGLLRRLPSAPNTPDLSDSCPSFALVDPIEEDPSAVIHVTALGLTRRGAPQRPLIDLLRRAPNTLDLSDSSPPFDLVDPIDEDPSAAISATPLIRGGAPQRPLVGRRRAPNTLDLSDSSPPFDLVDPIDEDPSAVISATPLIRGGAPQRSLVGLLRRAPNTLDLSDSSPSFDLIDPIEEDPLAVIRATPLELTRRGAPQSRHAVCDSFFSPPFASLFSLPSASELPPHASSLLAPPGLEYSLRDSLFSSLDMYLNDDSLDHTSRHPWNTQFIGKGASGKVFRVGYKPKIWDPAPGTLPIASDKESEVASVKVIDMKKQTEGTLQGLVSEVIALKVLRKKRDDVADAKAKGRHMRLSDGLRFLLESASLPGIDDTVVLRAGRLYLLTKYYHCDLANYCFKISNDEKCLAFILSELTQGLNYLHHIGMVHLDLKPPNVFITHDRHCVIGDLGSSIHKPGFIMTNEIGILVDRVTSYTDGFCAPEIVQSRYNTDRFNCKADFWSLGVTMYTVVRGDGLNIPKNGFEDRWRQQKDYDGIGLRPKHMAKKMYEVGCPGRIVNLVLNMCQRDPKKRLGGRGIIRNLRDHGLLYSSPFDLSPLPDVWIPPCGLPGPDSEGAYHKLDMKDACKILKENIECKGYNLVTM